MPVNDYSPLWFSTFLGSIDSKTVEREAAFIERQLPRPGFERVLDLCCGTGRHAVALAAAGYSIVALDRSEDALKTAGETTKVGHTMLLRAEMRALPLAPSSVDAVICMWQSFGQFDSETNRSVLASCARALRPGGRFILDLYNREFHERHAGTRRIDRGDIVVSEARTMSRSRLDVSLTYESSDSRVLGRDHFEWQLYSPAEIAAEAASVGMAVVAECAEFDEAKAPSRERPRMQLVFSRPSAYL